ncbi:MAG: restriction endonuclease subunit S [Coriobacteriales bacterium]|jgi:type I restriction enzyme S subunit
MKCNWTQIGNVIEYSASGGWGKDEQFNDSIKVAVIRGADFPNVAKGDYSDLPIRWEKKSKVEKVSLQPGDVVLENSGGTSTRPTGRSIIICSDLIASYDIPVIPASFCRILRFGQAVDAGYGYYWLQDMYKQGRTWGYQNRSTGLSNFQYKIFAANERIAIRPMTNQKAIAILLGKLDEKIRLNNRLNDYLSEIAKAIFNYWISNTGEDRVSVSEIAELNPEKYSPGREKWPLIQYLDTGSITRGNIDGYQIINSNVDKLPSRARRKVRSGDIIYSNVRPNQEHYGIILNPDSNVLVSTGFTVIRSTDEHICPEILYLFLTQSELTKSLQQIAEQSVSTYPSIKAEDIGALKVPLPTEREAAELKNFLELLFKMMEANRRENGKLADFRNSLLPKLVSGEIDVSKVDLKQLNNHLDEH